MAAGLPDQSASRLSLEEAAARAASEPAFIAQLLSAGMITPQADGMFTEVDVRKAGMVRGLLDAGIPFPALAEGVRRGVFAFDFAEAGEYARFATLTDETFSAASRRTGVPVELLTMIREAIGGAPANPEDRVRSDEQVIVGFVTSQHSHGFRPQAIERLLRVEGDALRRVAEAEAEWWRTEVLEPNIARGLDPGAASAPLAPELSGLGEATLMAIFHAQEAQTWLGNIVQGVAHLLAKHGLYQPTDHPPAICFLDITGYTRLTQERGDRAAAEVAETLSRIVKRRSVAHAGRPVKWLGDGVMFHFRESGPAVVSALEMVEDIASSGLPPAHVGVHAGPVVMQDGDYFGQTVNLAARIADYARPGEVLVSRLVVEAAAGNAAPSIVFAPIGGVELKGVVGSTELFAARIGTG